MPTPSTARCVNKAWTSTTSCAGRTSPPCSRSATSTGTPSTPPSRASESVLEDCAQRRAEGRDAGDDAVVRLCRVAESRVVPALGDRKEGRARYVRDLRLRQGVFAHEPLGVEVLRERQPREQTTLRIGEVDGVREMSPYRVQHDVFLVVVRLAQFSDVGIDVARVEIHRHRGHVERAALRVGGELEEPELLDDVLGGDGPTEAQSWGEDLGEAADEDDAAFGVETLQRRQTLALEADLSV